MSEQLNISLLLDTSGMQKGADQAANVVKGFVADAQREIAKIGNKPITVQMTLEGAKTEKTLNNIQKQTDKVTASIKKTTNAQKLFGKQTGVTQQQLQKSINTLRQVAQQHKAGTAARRQANASLQAMQQRLAAVRSVNASGMFQRMGKAMGGLSGQFAVGAIKAQLVMQAFTMLKNALSQLAPAMIQRKKDVEGLALALSGFLSSEKEVNAVMASSKAIALTYGGSIREVDAAYKRLTPTILAAGGDLKSVEQTIIAMTARTTQLGLSNEQTGRYMEAIAQIMGKGKLQAEELTKQLSQLDGALRSQIETFLAAEYGIEDMYKAMEQGEVTAEMFREAFVASSQDIAAAMKRDMNAVQTIIGQTRNGVTTTIAMIEARIENLNTLSLDSLNETFSGLGEAVLRIRAGFAQFFASITTNMPATQEMFKSFFNTLGLILELIVNGFINGARVIFQAFEYAVRGANAFNEALQRFIPGLQPLIEFINRFGERMAIDFRKGTDELNKLGPTATKQIQFLDTLSNAVKSGPVMSVEELNQKVEELAPRGIEAQQKYLEEFMKSAENQKEEIDAVKETGLQAIDDQITKLTAMQEERNAMYAEEIQNIDRLIEKENEKMAEIRANMDEEWNGIQQIYNEKMAALNAEIGILRQRTPMEQKLREMQMQELKDKIASGELEGKQLVAAQARLERMQAQDAINKLLVEKEELRTEHAEDQAQHQSDLNDLLAPYQQRIDELEQKQKELTENKEREQEATKNLIEDLKTAAGYQKTSAEDVKNQQAYARLLAGNYSAASEQAGNLAAALNAAADAQERLNRAKNDESEEGTSTTTVDGRRASGGPVTGGSTYQVNELGKEAFLSASGKLSMINAPAFGNWKAPGSGTVIPAHLTKKLGKIPGGGINLNKTAGANAMGAGNGMGSMVRAIQGAMSGDTFHQNVTVQSSNPTQTANNMMVEMTRLRRRRFG